MLKVVAACGNGMGSSLMVKMKIEKVLRDLNIPAKVEHMSIGDAKNAARNFDVVICSSALAGNFNHLTDTKVIGLTNLLSEDEIKEKLSEDHLID